MTVISQPRQGTKLAAIWYKDVENVCAALRAMREAAPRIGLCASLGLLSEDDLAKLKAAGLQRVHCNLETAPSLFPSLCTTHTPADKLATLRAAKKLGFQICCGGIIGMGETDEQLVEFAFALKEIAPDSIPRARQGVRVPSPARVDSEHGHRGGIPVDGGSGQIPALFPPMFFPVLHVLAFYFRRHGESEVGGMKKRVSEIGLEFMRRSGKRLRPRLCEAVYRSVAPDGTADIGPLKEAVECFHKASLIHDDIQDFSRARDGMPTVWVEYGVPLAIAAGIGFWRMACG